MTQINTPTKQKRLTDIDRRLVVAKEGGGVEEEKIGNLELAGAN